MFNDSDAESWFPEKGNYTENSIVDGVLTIDILAGLDPYLTIKAGGETNRLDALEYPVLVMKVRKSENTPTEGEFFFKT